MGRRISRRWYRRFGFRCGWSRCLGFCRRGRRSRRERFSRCNRGRRCGRGGCRHDLGWGDGRCGRSVDEAERAAARRGV